MESPDSICYTVGPPKEPIYKGSYSFNTGETKTLSTNDYIVFALILVVSIMIGCYYAWQGRKAETMLQFLLEYHSMPAFHMGLSAFASFASAITMLGGAAETYDNSIVYISIGAGLILVGFMSAHIFHPVLYRLDVTTSHQYLELRFAKSVRAVAAIIFIVHMLAYNSLVLTAPSAAFTRATGYTSMKPIFSIGIICVISTALGGMKGIVGTDVFHVTLMFASLVLVLIRAGKVVGDFQTIVEATIRAHDGLLLILDSKKRDSAMYLTLGGFFTYGCFLAVNQNIVQKTMSCNSLKDAKIAVYIAVATYIVLTGLSCVIGFYMGAFYENCDPLQVFLANSSDQILPLFVADIFSEKEGLTGLFAAGLFSASLSTMSSSISSATATILEDLIQSFMTEPISQRQARSMAKLIGFIYGLFVLTGTYIVSETIGVLKAMLAVTGVTMGPIFGVFSLGIFFPWANTKGAICGMVASIAITLTATSLTDFASPPVSTARRCVTNCKPEFFNMTVPKGRLGKEENNSAYHLSYIWVSSLAVVLCVAVGLFVSLVTGPQDPHNIDRLLVVSLCDEVFPFFYLPERIRKHLRVIPLPGETPPTSRDHKFGPPIQLGTFKSTSSLVQKRLPIKVEVVVDFDGSGQNLPKVSQGEQPSVNSLAEPPRSPRQKAASGARISFPLTKIYNTNKEKDSTADSEV